MIPDKSKLHGTITIHLKYFRRTNCLYFLGGINDGNMFFYL